MADKILGFAEVIVDGVVLLSGDDSTIDVGGIKRTPVVGNSVLGYREENMFSVVEVNVAIDADYSAANIGAITGATIQFSADTGQVWSIANGWSADPAKITQKDGKAKHTFNGPPATEILSGA